MPINSNSPSNQGAWHSLAGCLGAVAAALVTLGSAQASSFVKEGHSVAKRTDGGYELAAGSSGKFHPGWYVGLGVGSSHLKPGSGGSGWRVTDDSDSASRVFVGRHLTPKLRLEFNYSDLGSAGLTHTDPAVNATVPNAKVDYTSIGLNADWLFRPINEPWNYFARAGIASIDSDANDDAIQVERGDDVSLAVGAGVQWRGRDRWMARLAFERLASDSSWIGLSVAAYLGKAQSSQKTRAPAKAAENTVQLSVSTAEPDYSCRVVRRVVQGVGFDLESAELDADDKAMLDRIASALTRVPGIVVTVVGHTDSWGDALYNQTLSEKRANNVRDYLQSRPGTLPMFSARGVGEAEPLADNATADGRALNRRIELLLDNKPVCQG